MGLKFRKKIKICKGLSFNINKDSVGLSIGTKGAHYTVNSKGKRTGSIGIPGSGLYYTETAGGNQKISSMQNHQSYSIFKIILAIMTCGLSILFIGLRKK